MERRIWTIVERYIQEYDRYKEVMADYLKEAKKEFKNLMSQMVLNPPPDLMQQLASVMFIQHMTTQAPRMLLTQESHPSSTECPTVYGK
jgi:hypothetical protein